MKHISKLSKTFTILAKNGTTHEFQLRNIFHQDLQQVLRIQSESYPKELLEDEDVYTSYLKRFSSGAFGLFENNFLSAYCFSFPYFRGYSITYPQDGIPLPSQPNCYYLHDMAIDPKYRGFGLSSILFREIESIAIQNGFDVLSLTSVNNRRNYWEHQGFKFVKEIEGHDGDIMEKKLILPSKC